MKLLEHNEKTMRELEHYISGRQDCCVVNPCGSGKTFLMAELMERYSNSSFLIVTKQANARKYFINKSAIFKKANIVTYSKLGQDYRENRDFDKYKTDFLLIDEAHYMGASKWNIAIGCIKVKYNPVMIGFTATAQRYEQQGTEDTVVTDYFGGNSVGNYSSTDLCKKGLFIEPECVVSMYKVDSEVERRISKIQCSDMPEEDKSLLIKKLHRIESEWKKTSSPDILIKKYVPNFMYKEKCNRVLVYCANTDILKENRDSFNKFFKDTFPDKEIKDYIYTYKTSNKVFDEFMEEDTTDIKLLYSVDKIMETIHIDDLNIVLMLRPSVSNRIITQQYGRVNRIGSTDKPLILDFVCNLDNLGYAITGAYKKKQKQANNGSSYVNLSFIAKIRSSFDAIDKQLSRYPIYEYQGYVGGATFFSKVFECDKNKLVEVLKDGFDIEEAIKIAKKEANHLLTQQILDDTHEVKFDDYTYDKEKLDNVTDLVSQYIMRRHISDDDMKQDLYLYAYSIMNKLTLFQGKLDISRFTVRLDARYALWSRHQVQHNEYFDEFSETSLFDSRDLSVDCTNKVVFENLYKAMSTLTEREQEVLRLRFGLDDGRAKTLYEVGTIFKVTGNRIRQIEAKALRKLRHPSRTKAFGLVDLMNDLN